MMLLAGKGDLDQLFRDTRVERDPAQLADSRSGPEDLERALVQRRRRLDGDGLVN